MIKERNIKVLILSVWMWNLRFCCGCCFVGYVDDWWRF